MTVIIYHLFLVLYLLAKCQSDTSVTTLNPNIRLERKIRFAKTQCPIFPSNHVWNTRIDCLPVHTSSSTFINTIGPNKGVHPDFGSGYYNDSPIGIPYIVVSGAQSKYPVTFNYYDESDQGPYAIPLDAPIEGGSNSAGDRHVLAVDTDNCILYELFSATPNVAQQVWSAGSGAIYNLTGYTLRTAGWTSADAAGLPIFPGLVRYDEILAGEIRHAIRFTAPNTRKQYIWPARHYASQLTGSQYPPMGLRLRLKPSFDISSFSPTNQIILTALKRYGMILADNGSPWFLSGAPDDRWDNDDLHKLQLYVFGSNFEVVDTSSLIISENSGKANQICSNVSVSSRSPTVKPSKKFTRVPSKRPSRKPTKRPSRKPTKRPSRKPTKRPSKKPTRRPTKKPTRRPSRKPSKRPSRRPTGRTS